MRYIQTNPFLLAERFVGTAEVPGDKDNPQVLAWLRLDGAWPQHDEVANCSAFVNWVAFILRLPRTKSLAARSWLGIGEVINTRDAEVGFDVVILKRGVGDQPGPEVLDAPGHVGFYAGQDGASARIQVLGANQHDSVNVTSFPMDRVLGVRRIG